MNKHSNQIISTFRIIIQPWDSILVYSYTFQHLVRLKTSSYIRNGTEFLGIRITVTHNRSKPLEFHDESGVCAFGILNVFNRLWLLLDLQIPLLPAFMGTYSLFTYYYWNIPRIRILTNFNPPEHLRHTCFNFHF